jgi:DeoR family transcriptional regulator, fructose operon transcriptional repressor
MDDLDRATVPPPATGARRVLPAARQALLVRHLSEQAPGVVDLGSLATMLGVSVQTVRRDLEHLAAAGLVERTFGGAIVRSNDVRFEPSYDERTRRALAQKRAIAEVALGLLHDDEGLFLDGSSTVLQLARILPTSWSGDAVTAGLPALIELAERPRVRLTLVGGEYLRESHVVRGATTLDQLRTMRFDTCVVSARAVHPDLGACEARDDEAALKRTVISRSSRTILLADAGKLGRTAAHHVVPLSEVDVVVTDASLDPDVGRLIEAAGTTVLTAPTR